MRNEEAPSKHERSWNISSLVLGDSEEDDGDGEDRVARSPTPVSSVEWHDGKEVVKEDAQETRRGAGVKK